VEKINFWEERPILINICLKAVIVHFLLSGGVNNYAYLIGTLIKRQVSLMLMLICTSFCCQQNQLLKRKN